MHRRRALLSSICVLCLSAACREDEPQRSPAEPPAREAAAEATILGGPSSLGLRTGGLDASGQPERIPCSTCHGGSGDRPALTSPSAGSGTVHAHLRLEHGELDCFACHDASERDALHFADGRRLPTSRSIELCGQCHGPQKRDYDHHSHGGLEGYWDPTLGPQVRNHCIVCHDPHAPAYLPVMPAPGPRDRDGGRS